MLVLARMPNTAQARSGSNGRKWDRLTLNIPVFVRGLDEFGRPFVDAGSAINISAGGALIAVERSLAQGETITIEIPALLDGRNSRITGSKLSAVTVRIERTPDGHQIGVTFSEPLVQSKLDPVN